MKIEVDMRVRISHVVDVPEISEEEFAEWQSGISSTASLEECNAADALDEKIHTAVNNLLPSWETCDKAEIEDEMYYTVNDINETEDE